MFGRLDGVTLSRSPDQRLRSQLAISGSSLKVVLQQPLRRCDNSGRMRPEGSVREHLPLSDSALAGPLRRCSGRPSLERPLVADNEG